MITTIIFDLDGTLVDSERIYFETYRKACNDFGGDIDLDFFKDLLGKPQAYDKEMLLKRFGEQFPVDEVVRRHVSYSQEHFETFGVPLKAGALELLSYLKDKGYQMVVASSSHAKRIQHVLEETGMLAYIDNYIGGDEVVEGKPNPEIFLKAAALVGANHHECVVVEDSEAGIEAGYRAKMKVVSVPDLKYPEAKYEAMTNAVVDALIHLKEVVESL